MRTSSLSILLLVLTTTGMTQQADPFCRTGESTIIAFRLADSVRYVSLCRSSDKDYLVYRFGSEKRVELEYPNDMADTWSKFEYAHYLRGGGDANEGLDLNYLVFINGDWQYILYEEYQAAANPVNIGVKVINLKSNKKRDFPGLAGTMQGSLISLRDNDKVRKGDVPADF